MLLEQVLHIMLSQEYPRFFVYVFFRPQKYIFLHYAILWEYGKYEKKLYKRLQSHLYTKLGYVRPILRLMSSPRRL